MTMQTTRLLAIRLSIGSQSCLPAAGMARPAPDVRIRHIMSTFRRHRAPAWRRAVAGFLAAVGLLGAPVMVSAADAGTWSIELGLGVHPTGLDAPEVNLDPVVGTVALRYQRGAWAVTLEHTSGITTTESGIGFNVLTVRRRFDL